MEPASTGSPWFPREKDDDARCRCGGRAVASTGSPWFPREKGYNPATARPPMNQPQRGLPGFPGRRLATTEAPRPGLAKASTGSPWFPREKANGGQDDQRTDHASTGSPWFPREKALLVLCDNATFIVLQRGLPGFPGRRRALRGGWVGVHRDASTGSPWFPREKGDWAQAARGQARGFNGVSLVSQGEGRGLARHAPRLPVASTGSPWFPREKGAYATAFSSQNPALQRGLPGFPGRRPREAGGGGACEAVASTGSPWFPREKA